MDDIDEDQIEWVSGSPSSSSPSPRSSRKIARHTNVLEVPLKQIHFNSSTSQCINASEGSMALFLNDRTLEVSICLNNLKDEILFGMNEIDDYRITRDYPCIIFRLRSSDFNRSYSYHPKGYSFKDKSKSYPRNVDPTGGKLRGISCINFKPSYSIDRERDDFNLVDGWIRTMINRSRSRPDARKSRNSNEYPRPFIRDRVPQIAKVQNVPPRDYTNSNSDDLPEDIFPDNYNAIKKRELYITCIHPTQKRAIIYSSDGIFSHFQFYIKQRFDWKWERMWYRNKFGGWNALNYEDTWVTVKRQAINKQIPRIEVFMR